MPQFARSLLCAVAILGVALGVNISPAEDGSKLDDVLLAVPEGFDVEDHSDSTVLEFCREAILHDRGLTWSPFFPPTDSRIAKQLAARPEFLKALDASIYVCDDVEPPLDELPKRADKDLPILDLMQRKSAKGEEMKRNLTLGQRRKLPAVYLYLEGMGALCRPEFTSLFEKKETPEAIRKLYEETWHKKVAPFYRALFTLRETHDKPILQLGLRASSFQFDYQIAELLSKGERKKLAAILDDSEAVHGEAILSALY